MSKLIKPILIPNNIEIIKNKDFYQLKSLNGILNIKNNILFNIEIIDRNLKINLNTYDKKKKKYIGTMYSILKSQITGLNIKFKKILLIIGIGYKAYIENENLILILGFSHNIFFKIPNNILIICQQNKIIIEGVDKQLVGQVAANIRSFKKPDVYKGKGIKYENEKINMKEIKKK